MKLIHTTNRQGPDGIRTSGFKDGLHFGLIGVCMSDQRLREMWLSPDEVVFIEINMPADVAQQCKVPDDEALENGYPIWVIPAEILNSYRRREIDFLATPSDRSW